MTLVFARTFIVTQTFFLWTACVVIVTLLSGCEAALNLEGVNAEKTKPIRRTDQLMAVTEQADKILVFGSHGLVLSRDKTSESWTREEVTGKPNFVDATQCPDGSIVALAMEKQIWLRANTRADWQIIDFNGESPESFISLTCAPDNSLWMTGSFSTLLTTTDLGKNWQQLSLDQDASINSLQFFNERQAIIVGEFGLVAHTNDAGKSWHLADPIPDDFSPLTAWFESPSTGWVAGLGGVILATTDGGKTWQREPTPTESPVYGIYTDGINTYAFADHGTVLKRTINKTWEKVALRTAPVYLRDGLQLPGDELLVVGGWGSLVTVPAQ